MELNRDSDQSWFEEWFDTPYYHLLYQHRDDREAQLFIDALFKYLKPEAHWHILDLACGRGRHARYMHNKGYEVTGLDLAESNIEYASQFLEDKLHFKVADMREAYGEGQYNLITNLFTSFAYFESWTDNLQALKQVKKALKPGGYFVLDFLNVEKLREHLIPSEEMAIEGYRFSISRDIKEGRILKKIDLIEPNGLEHHFKEEVWALSRSDFEALFRESGLEIEACFGSYNLAKFADRQSERLILLARA